MRQSVKIFIQGVCAQTVVTLHVETFLKFDFDPSLILILIANFDSERGEMVLMMGHNIYFEGVIWKIFPQLPLYSFLFGALIWGHFRDGQNTVL